MWTGKKIFIIAASFFVVIFLSFEVKAEKKVGILMFSEEARYNDATRGIIDQLKEDGYAAPKIKLVVENAGANKARASELVRLYAAEKMDLIITLGTSITIPLAKEIKDVPIVFGVVYDPVEAGIARNWKSSGNNTTGASTKIPMSELIGNLKEFKPVKRLAVLYTPGEKNSETQLKDLQETQPEYKIKIIPVPLTKKEEVGQILPEVMRTSDAVYVTGSNLVNSQVSMIVDMASKANVVTITHLEDLVGKGVLLGVCSDSYRNGRLAGEKAVKILRGAKPSSIPIESPKEYDVMINMETARAGRFQIPPDFMKTVTKKIN